MEKNIFLKKLTAFIVITLFIAASFIPSISGNSIEYSEKLGIKSQKYMNDQEDVLVTCYNFGLPGEPSKEIEIPQHEAEYLLEKIKELNFEVASNPLSEETQQLQDEIVDLADGYGLLPAGLSKSKVKEYLVHSFTPQTNRKGILPTQSKASEFLCTFVSTGSGGVLPIIALPRLIPILMIPIPRLFMRWKAQEAMTSCGGLRSGTGFIAYGQQKGVALGFWGLGFTFSLPPLMGVYGLIGYALFATVTAEEIEYYPPNSPPVISQINPYDGEINVPLSTSELQFEISDFDGDLMSYTVTTTPDIGSGNGNLKPDGVYSIPINDLTYDKIYRWTVEVEDGKDIVQKEFTFFTESKPPFDPFDEGWQYRKQIIIDHTKVDGELNDFPVLLSITDTDLRDKTQDDGDDILFMDGSGVATKLYHEIEYFDSSTGELVAWVRMPTLSSAVDTELFIYYGNPSCGDEQIPEKVWDSNYAGVWHLDETSGNHYDSTSFNNHGTPHFSPSENQDSAGKILGADYFDGDMDYIYLGNDPILDGSSVTVTHWIRYTAVPSSLSLTINDYTGCNGDWGVTSVQILSNGSILGRVSNGRGNGNVNVYSPDALNTGNWIFIATTYDNIQKIIKLYVNDELVDESTWGDNLAHQNDVGWYIGAVAAYFDDSYWPHGPFCFEGYIDEVHILKINRNSEWISTEYNNQNDPSSFMSIGPEEPAP